MDIWKFSHTSQISVRPDQHHGQGPHSHPASPNSTHQRIVGDQAAWGFKARPCKAQGGWGPATKLEGESMPLTNSNVFLNQNSPVLPWRRRGGLREAPATRNQRTCERNRSSFWSEHNNREQRKVKVRKNVLLTMCSSWSTSAPLLAPGSTPEVDPGPNTTRGGRRNPQTPEPAEMWETHKGTASPIACVVSSPR